MKKIALLFLLTIPGWHVDAQDSTIWKKLDAYYSKVISEWGIPGMSIGIIQDGKLVFSHGYGTKEVGKNDPPDDNTLYAIASNSKAFTTAMMAVLVQQGYLDWNDKVQDILPYFELYNHYVSSETNIRDILSHRVGLGTFSGDVIWYKSTLSAEEIIRRIKYLPPAYDFRSGYGYSNLMYITAGEIIHQLTGKSWGENIRQTFLEPLQMDRTIYRIAELKEKGNYATPHGWIDGKHRPIPWVDWETIAATGGLISSVKDISKWVIFNLNNGILGNDTILTSESRNLIWTPHNNHIVNHTRPNNFDQNFNAYGLGWGISDYHGHFRVGHTGGYDGMISAINLLPDEKLAVIVLTNGLRSPIMAVTYYTLDLLFNTDEKDWSKEMLEERIESEKQQSAKGNELVQIFNSAPSLTIDQCVGIYVTPAYGEIEIKLDGPDLQLHFSHSPDLSADLTHWHYDVWKINWHQHHAWFDFGTIKFETDHDMNVKGISFDVPNQDIFFEEINAMKVK